MGEATFDTLTYFEELKQAGVPEAQAKVQATTFHDFAREQREQNLRELATKADLRELELRLLNRIQEVRIEVKESQNALRNWFVGTSIAIIAALIGTASLILSRLP